MIRPDDRPDRAGPTDGFAHLKNRADLMVGTS